MPRTRCLPTGASGSGAIEAARRHQGARPEPRAGGPWCTQLLADLGAEVLKIERPGSGDDTRHWGPPWHGEGDERVAAYFLSCNRGKKSAAIDFAPGTKARRWSASWPRDADVVVENFKVGGLEKFGLDAKSLRAANPRLVYASITGFGQDGPYADRAGYDYIIQGMGGLMSITGLPDGEPGGGPMRVGVAVVDLFTGLYTCVAILAALYRREKSGRGRAYRHGAVRHAAGDARQPGVECAGFGQGPAAPGQHAPQYRALSAVRRGRSADHHRRRQRAPVRAAGRDLRPSRMDRTTRASHRTRARVANREEMVGLVGDCDSPESRRRNGSSSSRRRAFRPARSTASARR